MLFVCHFTIAKADCLMSELALLGHQDFWSEPFESEFTWSWLASTEGPRSCFVSYLSGFHIELEIKIFGVSHLRVNSREQSLELSSCGVGLNEFVQVGSAWG